MDKVRFSCHQIVRIDGYHVSHRLSQQTIEKGTWKSLRDSKTLHVSHRNVFGKEYTKREMKITSALVPNGPVLDIGCGKGIVTWMIPGHIQYLGLDFNADHLKNEWDGREVEARICGNAIQLPFINSSFHTILLRHVIEHLPGPLQVQLLKEAYRVLSNCGTLILSTPNLGTLVHAEKFLPPHDPTHFRCLNSGEVKALLTTVGFRSIRRHAYDLVVEYPSSFVRLIPQSTRRLLAKTFPPLDKHLIFTATKS